MKNFFRWLFELPDYPVGAPSGASKSPVVAQPAVINPVPAAGREFAEWRAAHIDRWLSDPENVDHPNRWHLAAERDMHVASLKMES